MRIDGLFDAGDGVHQARNALQRIIFALNRDEDAVRRAQCVDGQQPQGRRAVDEDEIEILLNGLHGGFQAVFTLLDLDEFEFRVRQPNVAARNGQVLELRLFHHVREFHAPHDDFIDALVIDFHAQAGCRVALRVEVNHQHTLSHCPQQSGKVDGGGRFADAALLVDYRNDLRHVLTSSGRLRALFRVFPILTSYLLYCLLQCL